jgi:enoyl-CoA hydratase
VRTIAYTGQKLSAERAHALGFVSETFESVEDLMAGADAMAEKISKKSPLAIAASKASITYAREHTVADALQHCALLQSAVLDAGDIAESLTARQDKRAAEFKDLVARA